MVWDTRVPERAAVLLEVGLLGNSAGPIYGGTGTPAVRTVSGFVFVFFKEFKSM